MPIFYRFSGIKTYLSKICFSLFYPHQTRLKPLQGWFPGTYESWFKNTRILGLPGGENLVILRSLVLTHYQRVTDAWTDRHAAYSYSRALA